MRTVDVFAGGHFTGGHDGMANLCKPITAYDFHVRYDKIYCNIHIGVPFFNTFFDTVGVRDVYYFVNISASLSVFINKVVNK